MRRREHVEGVVIVVERQPELLQVVLALGASRRLTSLLNRREQQGDQDRDDCDHDQEFDEGEAFLATRSYHVDCGC